MSPFLSTLGAGSVRGFGRVRINTIFVAPPGQQLYENPGTYTFTVPAGVTSVSVVCVGGGGGSAYNGGAGAGGGALAYTNNISVTPGSNCTVVVGDRGFGNISIGYEGNGGNSSFTSGGTTWVNAGGGTGGTSSPGTGGSVLAGTGGAGGNGGSHYSNKSGGGGGAGGYSGAGGTGGNAGNSSGAATNGSAGTGGAAGGGAGGFYYSDERTIETEYYNYDTGNFETATSFYQSVGNLRGGGGGGVGVKGVGSSGTGGVVSQYNSRDGAHGSGGGTTPVSNTDAGCYGGGGGGGYYSSYSYSPEYPQIGWAAGGGQGSSGGGFGAVRIIWGAGRSFPSNAADV